MEFEDKIEIPLKRITYGNFLDLMRKADLFDYRKDIEFIFRNSKSDMKLLVLYFDWMESLLKQDWFPAAFIIENDFKTKIEELIIYFEKGDNYLSGIFNINSIEIEERCIDKKCLSLNSCSCPPLSNLFNDFKEKSSINGSTIEKIGKKLTLTQSEIDSINYEAKGYIVSEDHIDNSMTVKEMLENIKNVIDDARNMKSIRNFISHKNSFFKVFDLKVVNLETEPKDYVQYLRSKEYFYDELSPRAKGIVDKIFKHFEKYISNEKNHLDINEIL